ncbi:MULTISPECIES: hypothetical protein [Shewanella]|uniref:PilZ domain-containing protein n=1 Tax=Shewanella decolorationis TaxID=256839 RepID=A0A5B8QZ17_9GAMM|nr:MULTISPECIES: hypothetical protein [Shewanella]MDH1470611.1 hypothetical protein [Shewanella sp. GD03713]QDZ91151.1 hypothetical protein D0436_12110 [Shewanella decolorationis]QXN26756.1 hypothetical protein KVP08_009475 [Shewanella putrefaciens]
MFTDTNPYFSVPHPFTAYLSLWDENQPLPSEMALRSMQSLGIQLLSEVKALEASCLLQLRHLDNEAKVVVDFLKLQSRKVDLVLQHVLEKEVQEGDKFSGCQFGGSGIRLMSNEALPLGRQYKVTLFIHEELVAILCFAKVTACLVSQEGQSDGPQAPLHNAASPYLVDLEFSQILDADVEQLVKASLNVQQKQLKLRKLARDERQ